MNPNPPDWKPGDEITSGRLNDVNAYARSTRVSSDPGSGLDSRRTSAGTFLRSRQRGDCWVKITSSGGAGAYGGTQQVETSATGTWADGPLVFVAADGYLREANSSTTVPTGGTVIVRAWRAKHCWRFLYGAC